MPSTIERALELARSGDCASFNEVRKRLSSEGFTGVEQHLAGGSIKAQLRRLLGAATLRERRPERHAVFGAQVHATISEGPKRGLQVQLDRAIKVHTIADRDGSGGSRFHLKEVPPGSDVWLLSPVK